MPGAGRVGMMGAHRRGLVVLAAIITIALIFSMSAECLAGDDYTWIKQNPLPEGQYSGSVSAADSTHVWAVGAGGAILFYNGTTLGRQYSSSTYNLNGVHALDATNVWAVGEAGTILYYNGTSWSKQGIGVTAYDLEAVWATPQLAPGTPYVWAVCDSNGFTNATILAYNGTSWSVQYTYPSGGLVDISGYDANNVWAVDCETHYYNGTSWQVVNPGGGPDDHDPYMVSACSANDIWSITWWGEVLKSSNKGVTWESTGLYDYWPVNISALSNSNVWVSGWDGKISYYNGVSWTEQPSGTTQDLYDVCALDSTHVYSVGSEKFLFSRGGGWTEQASGTTANILDVDSVSADEAWAVGWNAALTRGEVLRYYGGSWSLRATLTGYSIVSVAAAASNSVWIVDEDGWIYKWDGVSWTTQLNIDYPLYDIVALDTSHVWAVGATGMIRYTANGGTNWGTQASGTAQNLYGVSALSTGSAWAVGAGGTILYTSDWGANWASQASVTAVTLRGVSAVDSTHVWAVGDTGTVLFFDGTSWSVQDGGTAVNLNAVSAAAANCVWAVGANGTIRHYNGTSWGPQASGTAVALRGVSAFDANSAWAVGDAGTALFNGGSAWSALSGGTTENLRGVDALSTDVVWAVGDNSAIQYTSSGGETWTPQSCPTAVNLNAVSAVNTTFAWAVGWNPSLSRGEDLYFNGSTWALKATSAGESNTGVTAPATNRIWDVTSIGNIWLWKTPPPAGTWSKQYDDITDRPLNAVSAASTLYVWAVGNEGRIYRTTDGVAWGSQTSGTTANLHGVRALSTSIVWAVGASGTILYTSDGGTNWTPQASGTTVTLRGVSAVDGTHVWAVGDGGTILFYNGSAWAPQESPVTVQLNGVDGFDTSNIWAVGDGGTILYCDPPFIKRCYPTWGNPGQTMTVEVVGAYTHFNGSSVVDFGEGIAVVPGSLQIFDYTKLRVQITIDPYAARGPRDISVVTGAEEAVPLAGGFMVGPDPAITGTEASYGLPGWTGDVIIEGNETHFDLSGQAGFGEGIAVNYIKDIQPDKATANITISPNASLGGRDVNLVSGNETPRALAGGFAVVNTPEGTGVKVNPDSATTVEFDRVTSAGITTSDEKPDPGTGGYLVVRGTCRDVSTTATYSGNVRVTLSYPDSGLSPEEESRLVILHEESGSWVDRTKSRDTEADRLTAEVGGLSRFVVALPGEEPSELSRWYLAEGTTAWGFNTYITLMNPNDEDVTADVTYMTPEGPVQRDPLLLPALSQTSVAPANDLPFETDFSCRVVCAEGKAIAVDRTMWWTGQGALSPDGHCSIGVNAPAETWYLPEGCSAYGFETWLLVQNPNDTDATCQVTYMTGEDATGAAESKTFEKKIPANSRATYNMADDIGQRNASIKVDSDLPVIPERSMYRNSRREGHDSIGATTPETDYYLAEGTCAHGFETYLLVQNPGDSEARVTVTYMTGGGPVPQPPFKMPPDSRETIRVNDVLPDTDFSIAVSADKPIVAERAMYWGADTPLGEASHDTVGLAGPHTTFYLPDGKTADGHETYTLVANPNDTAVEVEVTYLTPDGTNNATFTATVAAGSRATFNMADEIPDGQAAIVVTCKTAGAKIMAERAMYWNDRGAGTCTIGGYGE